MGAAASDDAGIRRWTVTVGCLYGAGATGLIYLFSVYSSALKKRFDLSQRSLQTIEICMFLAGTCSVFSGVLVDRLGPANGVRLGGGVMAAIFVLQFLVCERSLGLPDTAVLPVLCALCAVQFLSSSCITASVFSTLKTVYSPYESAGWVVGVGKGWVGLFGAIVTQLYSYTAGAPNDSPNTFEFLLFLAGAALALTMVPSLVVTKHPHLPFPPLPYHSRLQAMTFTVVLTCAVTATGAFLDKPSSALRYGFLSLLLILFSMPLVSASKVFDTPEDHDSNYYSCIHSPQSENTINYNGNGGGNGTRVLTSPLLGNPYDECSKEDLYDSRDREATKGIRVGRTPSSSSAAASPSSARGAGGTSTWGMMQDPKCWLMLWCTFCVIGSGVMITTNGGQMVEAVGAPDGAAAIAVTLFSVAQSLGRLFAGLTADLFKSRLGWPPSAVLCIAAALSTFAHGEMAMSSTPSGIYAGVFLCGLGFGTVWPLMVVVAGDLFGTEHLGANYNFYDGFSSACGSVAFALLLPSFAYDPRVDENGDCTEPACFRSTYAIIACINCSALLAAMVLTRAHAQQLNRELHKQAGQPGQSGDGGGRTTGGGLRGATTAAAEVSSRAQRAPQKPLQAQGAREGRNNTGGGGGRGLILPPYQQQQQQQEDEDRLSASLMEVDELASDYGNSQHGNSDESNGAANANANRNSRNSRDVTLSV